MSLDIEARLSEYVSEQLLDGDYRVESDEKLLTDGLVDSLGMMRLVGFISDSFDLEVPPEDIVIGNFATIARMAEYLRGRGVG